MVLLIPKFWTQSRMLLVNNVPNPRLQKLNNQNRQHQRHQPGKTVLRGPTSYLVDMGDAKENIPLDSLVPPLVLLSGDPAKLSDMVLHRRGGDGKDGARR